MFNSIKMHLVPHVSIILLHSLTTSLLNIYHAMLKLVVFPFEKNENLCQCVVHK